MHGAVRRHVHHRHAAHSVIFAITSSAAAISVPISLAAATGAYTTTAIAMGTRGAPFPMPTATSSVHDNDSHLLGGLRCGGHR